LYASPDIVRMIISRRMRWAGHVTRMREMRSASNTFFGKSEGKRPLGKSRRRWEDNIRMDRWEKWWEEVDWMHLAQDRARGGLL